MKKTAMTTGLFDCDNTLVESERLAFLACCGLVNEILARKLPGVSVSFTPAALEHRFVGKTFRHMILELAEEHGFTVETDELSGLVTEEENRVINILLNEVETTRGVNELLSRLQGRHLLAVVSSSALRRVNACLEKADQVRFFGERVYSATTSLPEPKSKPAPDVYLHALKVLAVSADECYAVEDSRSGVLSGVAAGILVIGYVGALPVEEQEARRQQLLAAGAAVVIADWTEFEDALASACDQQPEPVVVG